MNEDKENITKISTEFDKIKSLIKKFNPTFLNAYISSTLGHDAGIGYGDSAFSDASSDKEKKLLQRESEDIENTGKNAKCVQQGKLSSIFYSNGSLNSTNSGFLDYLQNSKVTKNNFSLTDVKKRLPPQKEQNFFESDAALHQQKAEYNFDTLYHNPNMTAKPEAGTFSDLFINFTSGERSRVNDAYAASDESQQFSNFASHQLHAKPFYYNPNLNLAKTVNSTFKPCRIANELLEHPGMMENCVATKTQLHDFKMSTSPNLKECQNSMSLHCDSMKGASPLTCFNSKASKKEVPIGKGYRTPPDKFSCFSNPYYKYKGSLTPPLLSPRNQKKLNATSKSHYALGAQNDFQGTSKKDYQHDHYKNNVASRWDSPKSSSNSNSYVTMHLPSMNQVNLSTLPNTYLARCSAGNANSYHYVNHWTNQLSKLPSNRTRQSKPSGSPPNRFEHLKFMEAILLDLYEEEIPPSSEEIRRRLDKNNPSGISSTEFLEICRVDSQKRFKIEEDLTEVHIYLNREPVGFQGFIDPNSLELPYSANLIPVLFYHLVDRYTLDPKGEAYKGGRFLLAELLKSSGPYALRILSQGRLCHLLQKCLDLGLLSYENNAIRPAVACNAMCKAYFAKNSPSVKPEARAKQEQQIRLRLKAILDVHPTGLAMCRLPVVYKQEYDHPLSIERLGYTKLADFLHKEASDICIIKPGPKHRCLVLPKKESNSESDDQIEANKYSGLYRLSTGELWSKEELTSNIIETLRSSRWYRLSTFTFWYINVNGATPKLNSYANDRPADFLKALHTIWKNFDHFGEIQKATFNNFTRSKKQKKVVESFSNSSYITDILVSRRGKKQEQFAFPLDETSLPESTAANAYLDQDYFPHDISASPVCASHELEMPSTGSSRLMHLLSTCNEFGLRSGWTTEFDKFEVAQNGSNMLKEKESNCEKYSNASAYLHKLLPLEFSCVPAESDQFTRYLKSRIYNYDRSCASQCAIHEEPLLSFRELQEKYSSCASVVASLFDSMLDVDTDCAKNLSKEDCTISASSPIEPLFENNSFKSIDFFSPLSSKEKSSIENNASFANGQFSKFPAHLVQNPEPFNGNFQQFSYSSDSSLSNKLSFKKGLFKTENPNIEDTFGEEPFVLHMHEEIHKQSMEEINYTYADSSLSASSIQEKFRALLFNKLSIHQQRPLNEWDCNQPCMSLEYGGQDQLFIKSPLLWQMNE